MNKQDKKATFDIDKATASIFALEAKAKDHYRAGDECLKQIGQILIDGKNALPHGEFTAWRQTKLNKSERYCQNCMIFAEKFDNLDTHGIGYSRLELLAQMDIAPEVIETVAEAVSKAAATKTETGELKKLISEEIKAGNLVRKEDIEPMLAKARKTARNNQKSQDAKKIDPAIENVVTERNELQKALQESNSKLEKVQFELKTVTDNLKKFEESVESKATEKIETERAKLREQVEKQYSDKIEILEQTAEKRLNQIAEIQMQLAELKQAGNEIKRLKSENIALKTALEEKSKLVQEIEMYKDRIHSLEAILKSVKKNTPKDKLLQVIQQVESALHASA